MSDEARMLGRTRAGSTNNPIMVKSSPSVRTTAEDWLQAVHRSPSADTCKSHTPATELPYNIQTFDYVLWLI